MCNTESGESQIFEEEVWYADKKSVYKHINGELREIATFNANGRKLYTDHFFGGKLEYREDFDENEMVDIITRFSKNGRRCTVEYFSEESGLIQKREHMDIHGHEVCEECYANDGTLFFYSLIKENVPVCTHMYNRNGEIVSTKYQDPVSPEYIEKVAVYGKDGRVSMVGYCDHDFMITKIEYYDAFGMLVGKKTYEGDKRIGFFTSENPLYQDEGRTVNDDKTGCSVDDMLPIPFIDAYMIKESERVQNISVEGKKTIKDLIASCSAEMLLDGLAKNDDAPDGKMTSNFCKERYKLFLQKLSSIQEVQNPQHILLGVNESLSGKPHVSSILLKIDELERARFDKVRIPDISGLSESEIYEVIAENEECVPGSYSFIYEPWENVLGYQTDPENVAYIGKYNLLNSVLQEMTFFETDSEWAKLKFREDAKKKDEEVTKILKEGGDYPQCFVSAKEIYEAFGYLDNRSPEQKEASARTMAEEKFLNFIARYEVIKDFCERKGVTLQ